MEGDITTIAMYLPQFHQIKENDLWWGEGFTDWTSVKQAKPLKKGHIQPKIPLHGEYYDLLDKNTMIRQAELAQAYGLSGFCFYHYWFDQGRRLLEKPAENLLKWQDIPMNYCFCWANESWARSWTALPDSNSWASGYEKEGQHRGPQILALQAYGDENDWKEHFAYLLPFFMDKRYIKKDGRPVFVFYKPEIIDCLDEMITCWRKLAKEAGLPGLYIIGANMHTEDHHLDAALLHGPNSYIPYIKVPEGTGRGRFYDCEEVWQRALAASPVDNMHTCFGAFVGYDDSPRRAEKGVILENNTPELFEKYLTQLIRKNLIHHNDLIFINAWNEWGEGNMLEPDEQFGYGYLEALKRILSSEEYMTEKQYAIHHFEERFQQGHYFLYGSSANAETLVNCFDHQYHFIGLIDDRLHGERFGKPFYSVAKALQTETDGVIIAAQISSMYEIYGRIGERFRKAGIPVYDMYGNDLHCLNSTIRTKAYLPSSAWKEKINTCDVISFDLMDTFLHRDILVEGRVYINETARELYKYAFEKQKDIYFIADDEMPLTVQLQALKQAGIGTDRVLAQEDLCRNKTNGLYRILRLRNPEKKILHIGNDRFYDVFVPRMYDIDTLYFGIGTETGSCENTDKELITGMITDLLVKYTLWLVKQPAFKQMDAVLFTSRDGYLFKQIYDWWNEMTGGLLPASVYFRTSRRAAESLLLDRRIIQTRLIKSLQDKTEILKRFGLTDETGKNLEEILQEHIDDICRTAAENRCNYHRYLAQTGLRIAGNYAFMDFHASGSVQSMLAQVSPFTLTGFYCGINYMNPGSDGEIYAYNSSNILYEQYIDLERYIIAPELTVTCYGKDGPEFCISSDEQDGAEAEQIRQKALREAKKILNDIVKNKTRPS